MKAIATIIKYIIVFILAISITLLAIINIFSSTILEKEYILSKLEETGYYEEMYEYAKSNFENYIGQSGLDEEILNDIITKEMIKNDTQKIIENIYDGKNQKIETKEIEDNIKQNINKSLEGHKLTATQQKAIDEFVKHICKEYTASLVHTNYETKINNYYEKIIKYKEIANKILIVTAVACAIVLLLLNIKSISGFFVQLGVSAMVPAIILLVTNFFINTRIRVENIVLINDAFSKMMKNIIAEILSNFIAYGVILMIGSIVIIFLGNLLKTKKNI